MVWLVALSATAPQRHTHKLFWEPQDQKPVGCWALSGSSCHAGLSANSAKLLKFQLLFCLSEWQWNLLILSTQELPYNTTRSFIMTLKTIRVMTEPDVIVLTDEEDDLVLNIWLWISLIPLQIS